MPPRASAATTRPEEQPYWYVAEPNEARDREAAARKDKRTAKAAEREKRFEELKIQGNEAFKKGEYLAACGLYSQAVAATGHNRPKAALPALLNLAQTFLKLNAPDEAEEIATRALEMDPKNVKARYRRGLARKAQNLLYAAILDFETVVRVDPNCKEARVELDVTRDLWERGDGEETGNDDAEDEEPAVDAPPGEDDDESGSSDFEHEGNGTPCRYYNQSRCKRGRDCTFSHGPDVRAVRDNLGRNVCADFLIGRCRFSLDRCFFSHSTAYLPVAEAGSKPWWEDEEALRDVREASDAVDAFAEEMRALHYLRSGRMPGGRGRGRGRGRGGRGRGGGRGGSRWEREQNYGFTDSQMEDLLCQGVKPWDDDAWDVLDVLSGY